MRDPNCPPYAVPGASVARTPSPGLTPDQARQVEVLERQFRFTSNPYYSKVKFVAERVNDAPGPYTYTIPRGTEVRAFSYRIRESGESAGFTVQDGQMTYAETNLQQASQTIGGQNVLIHGLALQLLPSYFHLGSGEVVPHQIRLADARFTAAIWDNVSVHLSLNGDENELRMGIPGMIPGAGGLTGGTQDTIGQLDILGSKYRNVEFPTNGWPIRGNYYKVPEGMIWRNQSNQDSMLNVVFTVERTITFTSGGDPDNPEADVAAAATTQGFVYPERIGCAIMVHLIGATMGPRTRVM